MVSCVLLLFQQWIINKTHAINQPFFCFQNHSRLAETRLGPILAEHLPVHAIWVHINRLHTGNTNRFHWPGEWNRIAVHPVGWLQSIDVDPGFFGTSGQGYSMRLCQAYRLDSVQWTRQIFRIPLHGNGTSSGNIYVWVVGNDFAVSFVFKYICIMCLCMNWMCEWAHWGIKFD